MYWELAFIDYSKKLKPNKLSNLTSLRENQINEDSTEFTIIPKQSDIYSWLVDYLHWRK